MDRSIYLTIGDDEFYLGHVSDILENRQQVSIAKTFLQALRMIVEDLEFGTDNENSELISIELR